METGFLMHTEKQRSASPTYILAFDRLLNTYRRYGENFIIDLCDKKFLKCIHAQMRKGWHRTSYINPASSILEAK
ncbi:hypothetical protein ACET3Z_008726 [Daucus carota]